MSEVIQADRDAANALIALWDDGTLHCDDFVEAFAKHRLAHLTPNTDLSDERAREVLAACGVIVANYGGLAHSGNVLPGAAVLRAMHQYAAGLQGEVEQASQHLANVLFADPGEKEIAARQAAREWWQARDAQR